MSNLFSSQKLLVVVGPKISLSDYLVLTVVLEVLQKKQIQMDMLTTAPIPTEYAEIAALPKVNTISKLSPRKFILSFDKGNDVVKNIQWQQTDQKISFHISMDKGEFTPEGLNLATEGADYDSILYFRVNSFADVEAAFQSSASVVHQANNISLGGKFGIEHAKVELIEQPDAATLAETVVEEFKSQGTNAEHHTRLLSAILIETERLRKHVSGAKTFARCTELLNSGADLDTANALSDKAKKTDAAPKAESQKAPEPNSKPENAEKIESKPTEPKPETAPNPKK